MFFGLRNYILREISSSFYYDLIVGSKIDDYIKYIDPDNHIYKLNGGNIDLSFSDIFIGNHHNIAKTKDLSYVAWGMNNYKQINRIFHGTFF